MHQTGNRRFFGFALISVLAGGFILRLIKLDESLWLDEILTYNRAMGSVGYLLAALVTPLHEILVHFSLCLGDTEVLVRLPNVIAGMCGIAASYYAARSLAGRAAGLAASLLLATSAFHIHQCQWARYYALMMLAGLLWICLLHRCLLKGGRVNWTLYSLSCFFGLLVHQFCIPFLASMNLAAAAWLLFPRATVSWKRRLQRVGVLALCTGVGATGLAGLYVVQGRTPLKLLAKTRQQAEPFGESTRAEEENASEQTETPHQLTLWMYLQFMRELFFFLILPGRVGYFLLVLGIWGAVVLLIRGAPFGVMGVFTFCVTPIPLLLLPVAYPFANRYFSIALPVGLIFASVGIVNMTRHAAKWVIRLGQMANPSDIRPALRRRYLGVAHGVLIVLVLLMFAPATQRCLAEYYRWHPVWDWKRTGHYLSQTMTRDDVLCFIDPSRMLFGRTLTLYYLPRLLKNGEGYAFSVRQLYQEVDASALTQLANEYPRSNLWFCALKGNEGDSGKLLDSVRASRREYHGVVLWVLGEPTTNLIPDGGFENPDHQGGTPESFARVISGTDVYAGNSCLRLKLDKTGKGMFSIRINQPRYRLPIALRNAGFEAWRKNQPVGWFVASSQDSRVCAGKEAHSGSGSLELVGAQNPSTVWQPLSTGLAAGRTVTVEAFGKADAANQLALAVSYEAEGQAVRKNADHPGGGKWAPLSVQQAIPANAEPDSLRVELRCMSGTEGVVLVDDVKAWVEKVVPSLDPSKTYTFSMMIRYENLRGLRDLPNTFGAAFLVLSYHGPDGQDTKIRLSGFYGSKDWTQLAFQLKPGRDIPVGASWLLATFALYGSGTIWIDNVQFEPVDHPTPFTEGTRLPHDEWLGQALSAR